VIIVEDEIPKNKHQTLIIKITDLVVSGANGVFGIVVGSLVDFLRHAQVSGVSIVAAWSAEGLVVDRYFVDLNIAQLEIEPDFDQLLQVSVWVVDIDRSVVIVAVVEYWCFEFEQKVPPLLQYRVVSLQIRVLRLFFFLLS
jgi:hypothetical protein